MNKPTAAVPREDLAFKREEYHLERDKLQDKDARIMKWIIFGLLLLGLGFSFAGTLLDWSGASHTFTALVSLIGGNLIKPLIAFLPGKTVPDH